MAWFYEIRTPDNAVLKREGGFATRDSAKIAAREEAKTVKDSRRDNNEDSDRDEVGRYRFEDTINGVRLEIEIRSSSEGKFKFKAEGHGADLAGTVKPVKVRLMIGDDGGTTTFNGESN